MFLITYIYRNSQFCDNKGFKDEQVYCWTIEFIVSKEKREGTLINNLPWVRFAQAYEQSI